MMKITFVSPGIGISGGTKAIFEFANYLVDFGHEVLIVYPFFPFSCGPNGYDLMARLRQTKGALGNLRRGVRPNWPNFELKAEIKRVPFFSSKFLPDADILMATLWETAFFTASAPSSKGVKFYLAQHYEIWGGPKDLVDQSYKLGLKMVVNSTWLKNILERDLGVPVEALILHAPDRDEFYEEERPSRETNKNIRVLMSYRPLKWKGMADGFKAFYLAKQKHPNIELVLFGLEKGKDVPEQAEFHLGLYGSQLRPVYNSSHIFLYPSLSEGFGMPPLEAMACGCGVVTTKVGAVPDYAVNNQTALISEPGDFQGLADNLRRLIEDPDLREKIAQNAKEYTKGLTWANASRELERVLKKYV